jgi:hypothetical protein
MTFVMCLVNKETIKIFGKECLCMDLINIHYTRSYISDLEDDTYRLGSILDVQTLVGTT